MESAPSAPLIAASMREQAGEIADFEAIVRQYWPRVFRFALASLRDRDTAQTVAQDCFLRAYRARDRFRGEASLLTWLLQIAANLVRDSARNQRLRFWFRPAGRGEAELVPNWLPDPEIDPEQRMLLQEQVNAIWRITERLPERQRTVFLLRYVEEMALLEIAAVTGLKEGAVKVHLFRAVRAVRAHLRRSE
jgi:RNA polymerase sigma-70 factor, ECF subfamily